MIRVIRHRSQRVELSQIGSIGSNLGRYLSTRDPKASNLKASKFDVDFGLAASSVHISFKTTLVRSPLLTASAVGG